MKPQTKRIMQLLHDYESLKENENIPLWIQGLLFLLGILPYLFMLLLNYQSMMAIRKKLKDIVIYNKDKDHICSDLHAHIGFAWKQRIHKAIGCNIIWGTY